MTEQQRIEQYQKSIANILSVSSIKLRKRYRRRYHQPATAAELYIAMTWLSNEQDDEVIDSL